MLKRFLLRPIMFTVTTYWGMFWLLNAFDKILARENLGFLTWYGNHRVEKFTMYFDRLGFSPDYVEATLLFCGVVEFAAAGLFFWALAGLFKGLPGAVRKVDHAIAVSILIFFGFAIFDVIVGDRAELLEHSTYVGILMISYLASAVEGIFHHLRHTGPQVEQTIAAE